jgi:CubicO group peptidase (beta-lactamase class C family)
MLSCRKKMESGINARPIDFAKLGRLFLGGGSWNGEQVVPAPWVESSAGAGEGTGEGSGASYPSPFEQSFGTLSHERYWWRIAPGPLSGPV